jgi:hypothetical protein
LGMRGDNGIDPSGLTRISRIPFTASGMSIIGSD